MNIDDFNTMYNYLGKDEFAYIVVKKSKFLPITETRKMIIGEIEKLDKSQVMCINVNYTSRGYCVLQSIPKKGKFNSFLIKHKFLLVILERLGLNVDKLIIDRDIVLKHIRNIQSQEQRKVYNIERRKLKGNLVSDCHVEKKMLTWIQHTNKELNEKSTEYETRVYNRLKRTFRNRVTRQHPFVINGKSYFADICIKCKKIIIEVDGGYHSEEEQKTKDNIRDEAFKSIGYKTIRIRNEQVKDGKLLNEIVREILSIPDENKNKTKNKCKKMKHKVN